MDRDLLIIIIVGGILTFATYYYAYQSGKGLTLWADVSPKNRVYYSISGIFAITVVERFIQDKTNKKIAVFDND